MSSEVLQQRDLLVAERTDFLAKCGDKAEYCVVLPQWHYKQCADAADFKDTLNLRWQLAVTIVGPGIGEVDDALSTHEAGQQTPLSRPRRGSAQLRRSEAERKRVRNRLAAGGRWIRTSSSPREGLEF